MLYDAGPIIFYDQKFGGVALPEGEDTSEETRLRAAPVGVYELSFRQQPHYQFSGAFLFNDEELAFQRHEQLERFAVSEDIADAERILRIQSATKRIKLDSLEIIPLDWRENPIEFAALEVSETQRTISYRKDPPVESLKFKLSGVNVFDIGIVNSVLWTNGMDYSPGKLAAIIKRSEDIRIDQLENSSGGSRKLEEHLLTMLRLLLEKAPDRSFDFECSYRHAVGAGQNAFVPVLFQRSLNMPAASELFSNLMPGLRSWYENASPPEGIFDFGVKVYGAGSRESVPIMHLTGLVLPIESIAGWS